MENYINHSGGCPGSDMFWENEGNKYGITTIAYSFKGHTQEGKNPKILTEMELNIGFANVRLAEIPIGRKTAHLKFKPYIKALLSRNWYQVANSDAIFAIGTFQDDNRKIVNGGTGWAVQMAINNNKEVHLFDQSTDSWYIYDYDVEMFMRINYIPKITPNFAGIGTRELKQNGEEAIKEILKYNFNGISR